MLLAFNNDLSHVTSVIQNALKNRNNGHFTDFVVLIHPDDKPTGLSYIKNIVKRALHNLTPEVMAVQGRHGDNFAVMQSKGKGVTTVCVRQLYDAREAKHGMANIRVVCMSPKFFKGGKLYLTKKEHKNILLNLDMRTVNINLILPFKNNLSNG